MGNGGGYVGLNNANGETWLAGDGYTRRPSTTPMLEGGRVIGELE